MRIACLFIPHFLVAVERVRYPELRARPVVVGGTPEERQIVLDCSSEARQHGVRIGMTLREALSRCQEAAFLEAHHALYHKAATAIEQALGLISPLVESADVGRVFVGLDGLEALARQQYGDGQPYQQHRGEQTRQQCRGGRRPPWGGEGAMAEMQSGLVGADQSFRRRIRPSLVQIANERRIRPGRGGVAALEGELFLAHAIAAAAQQVTQLEARVGVADGKFTAFAAATMSRPRRPRLVPPGAALDFLASLPAMYLPLSFDAQQRLRLFGLRTLGQIAALPLGAVQAQFGPEGRLAWELANGVDNAPLIPQKHSLTLAERLSFPSPISNNETLLVAAQHLIARLTHRPEFARHMTRGLVFKAMLVNSHVWERRLIFREPLAMAGSIFFALRGKLSGIALPAAVEEVEVEFLDICSEGGIQGNLFTAQRGQQAARIDEVVRQLKSRYGHTLMAKVVEVEPWSRIPERRLALIDYDP